MFQKSSVSISNLMDCPSDIEIVAKWYFNEWDHREPKATIESVIKKVSSNSSLFHFVAHINGELAGAGELKYREYSDYPNYNHWIDGIYVSKNYRGKGISTILIEFAKSKALELKISALYLRCEDHLLKFYQSHGFQVVCAEKTKFIMAYTVNM
ncbi:GNAT family N-acetyltransferase [Alteromonas facilis]|uniref:GNAT family N-acetyltransferase n=1 Tax=Alteromonas facilis TaxID=2048004 RepID=UPI0013D8F8EC|nr:GNAT family N-acetyltransferase [Alteromonas facilis]